MPEAKINIEITVNATQLQEALIRLKIELLRLQLQRLIPLDATMKINQEEI